MVAARIVAPHTKLATTRWWHTTTLAEDFEVADASEDELYADMDWLLATSRARPIRWPNAAIIAMASVDICRSITAC